MHEDVINDFENFLLSQNRSLNTVRTYVSRIRQFNNSPYTSAVDWFNSIDRSQTSTIKISVAAMKSFHVFMSWEMDKIVNYKVPASKPPAPRPIPGGVQEASKIIDRVRESPNLFHELAEPLIAFGLYAGLRVSESIAVCEEDINSDTNMLLIHGKGMKYREVPVSERLQMCLRYVGSGGTYCAVSNSYARAIISKTFLNAQMVHNDGSPISSHDLRATFATEVYRKTGFDILTVQTLLGHANVDQTRSYLGVDVDSLHSAVDF